jgi:hypothetical protein
VIVDHAEYGRSLPVIGGRVLAAARDALGALDDQRRVAVHIDGLAATGPANGHEPS